MIVCFNLFAMGSGNFMDATSTGECEVLRNVLSKYLLRSCDRPYCATCSCVTKNHVDYFGTVVHNLSRSVFFSNCVCETVAI